MMNQLGMGHSTWILLASIFVIVPVWRICTRIGYSGWLSLLVLVPFVNLGLLYFIAFSVWPAESGKKANNNDFNAS